MTDIRIKKKNHAYIEVNCSDYGIANELTDFFTFQVPGYQFMPAYKNKMWDGKIRLYNSRDRQLYSGLYKYVQEFADTPGRDYKVELEHDTWYGLPGVDGDIDMSFVDNYHITAAGEKIQPRDYQLEAVKHGLENKQALLISPTASGKSLIIYLILRWYLENHDKNVLVIVPTTSLVHQMHADFMDYSTHDNDIDIDALSHVIYSGQEKLVKGKRITITTWQSIYKMKPSYFQKYGCVIGDEAHNFKAKSLTTILTNLKEAEYRFGTTGTLDGTQTHKLVLEGLFGPAYYVTTTKKLMDEGALSDLDIKMLLLKYSEEERKAFGKKDYQKEIEYIVSHEKRNRFITNLALDQDGNTLVLFNLVEKHGKPLYNLIKEAAHERRKIFYVSGEVDSKAREEIRHITEKQKNAIIVASLGTFSTGINIRNLHNVIFASPSKSQIKVLQSIGRGLRKSDDGRHTKLFDIADDLHWKSKKNYTLNHAAERIKIYSKEKFKYKIFEINI